jgi:hypothetical protein
VDFACYYNYFDYGEYHVFVSAAGPGTANWTMSLDGCPAMLDLSPSVTGSICNTSWVFDAEPDVYYGYQVSQYKARSGCNLERKTERKGSYPRVTGNGTLYICNTELNDFWGAPEVFTCDGGTCSVGNAQATDCANDMNCYTWNVVEQAIVSMQSAEAIYGPIEWVYQIGGCPASKMVNTTTTTGYDTSGTTTTGTTGSTGSVSGTITGTTGSTGSVSGTSGTITLLDTFFPRRVYRHLQI